MREKKTLFDPINNESVVEAVINRITNSIITGELEKGCRIPTEMEFSERLHVGRNSVREAIKVLVYLGVLEIRRPGGTYVRDSFSDKMLNPMLYGLILEDSDSSYIVELRHLFEVGVSNLAIQKATQEDLDNIKIKCDRLIAVLEDENTSCEMISQADIAFHEAVEISTHNPLIGRISSVITTLTLPSRIKTIEKIVMSGNNRFLVDSHKEIYEMLKSRDSSRVIDVVEGSYLFWKDVV